MTYQVSDVLLDTNTEIINANQVSEDEVNNPPIEPLLNTNEGKICNYLKGVIEQILDDEEGYGMMDYWLSTRYDETKLEEPKDELYSAAQVNIILKLDNPSFTIIILNNTVHPQLEGRIRAKQYRVLWNSKGRAYELPSLIKVPA